MNRKIFLTFCLLIAVTVIGWSQETASLPQYADGLNRRVGVEGNFGRWHRDALVAYNGDIVIDRDGRAGACNVPVRLRRRCVGDAPLVDVGDVDSQRIAVCVLLHDVEHSAIR